MDGWMDRRMDEWMEWELHIPLPLLLIFWATLQVLVDFLLREQVSQKRAGALRRLCHFQEQSSLLNPVLYWARESWIFRSITKMFLYVGAAPNRLTQRRQFRIQHISVLDLVSNDWSRDWGRVMCGGWGTACGHSRAEVSFWYSHTCPSFSCKQGLCSQAVWDAACKSAACLAVSGSFYMVT